ncbi:hypothetical protein BYT27DRAFT_7248882 [Phlegmacium glaucopus]|nr:hypothetical protein BYT27DRAFT_7248882 [Phlegmacium glaucopus]
MEENRPACAQCTGAGTMCHRKTQGPRCWRCYQLKKGCSLVGGKKRMVTVEMPAERVRGKGKGKGKAKEVVELETDGMERLVDGLEVIVGWLKKLVETQEGIRLVMEVWMRRELEKERRKEERVRWSEEEKRKTRVNRGVGMEEMDDEEESGMEDGSEEEGGWEQGLEAEMEKMEATMTTMTPRCRCLFQPPTNTVVSPPHPFQPPSARINHPPTRFGPISTTQPPFRPPPTHIDHHLPISATYTHCPHHFSNLPTRFGHLPRLVPV